MIAKFSDDGRLWVGLNDKNGVPIYQGDTVKMRVDLDLEYGPEGKAVETFRHGEYTGIAWLIPSMGAVIKDITYEDDDVYEVETIAGYKNIRAYRAEVMP